MTVSMTVNEYIHGQWAGVNGKKEERQMKEKGKKK